MILGFAHVTHGTDNGKETTSYWTNCGWSLVESHHNVASAPEKWLLCKLRPQFHDLYLLSGMPSLEVAAHDTGSVEGRSRIEYAPGDEIVRIVARNNAVETAFFCDGLRFEASRDGTLNLNSRFPQWHLTLKIIQKSDAPIDPPLDLAGLTCLAFYSTNPEADGTHLANCGGREITAPFQVELNGRKMLILMLRSPEGTIIELIKVTR